MQATFSTQMHLSWQAATSYRQQHMKLRRLQAVDNSVNGTQHFVWNCVGKVPEGLQEAKGSSQDHQAPQSLQHKQQQNRWELFAPLWYKSNITLIFLPCSAMHNHAPLAAPTCLESAKCGALLCLCSGSDSKGTFVWHLLPEVHCLLYSSERTLRLLATALQYQHHLVLAS